ncbi:MAG: hypothetical protein JEY91_04900 [Spirochaetaceae bacterium]|nr:hypothetical protein [Spirochaetaceae bacterium]
MGRKIARLVLKPIKKKKRITAMEKERRITRSFERYFAVFSIKKTLPVVLDVK